MSPVFDTSLRDSQSTKVVPISPEAFDFAAYQAYEASRLPRLQAFSNADRGLLVYRRVRADGVFYDQCQNPKASLALQLGALQTSMQYEADIPNFLEPWYGIGYIAAAFGADYVWEPGQAPAVQPLFSSAEEILRAPHVPIAETAIGAHILHMVEFFAKQTRGMLPISFCDIQSPLNMLTYLLPVNDLFLEIYDDPDSVAEAALLTAELLKEFLLLQKDILGDCLACPGHGFASSRAFSGIGMSDDTAIMVPPDQYLELFAPADTLLGSAFGGTVFHSCGNWERHLPMVLSLPGLRTADGAFSIKTDPDPNSPAFFADHFQTPGIALNARAVGSSEEVLPIFQTLAKGCPKLIAVTYCENPSDQKRLYDALHQLH